MSHDIDNSSSDRSLERLNEVKAFIEASKRSAEKIDEMQADAERNLEKLNEVVFEDAFELTGIYYDIFFFIFQGR